MAKLLGRLILIGAIGLAAYLYFQVTQLRTENAHLRAEIGRLSALRRQNEQLRAGLSGRSDAIAAVGPAEWLTVARRHAQKAESFVAAGKFAEALRQTQFANIALSRAADQASSRTSASVQSLRTQVDKVQAQATSLWHKLGV